MGLLGPQLTATVEQLPPRLLDSVAASPTGVVRVPVDLVVSRRHSLDGDAANCEYYGVSRVIRSSEHR